MILGIFVGFGGASFDVSPFREGSGSPVRGPGGSSRFWFVVR